MITTKFLKPNWRNQKHTASKKKIPVSYYLCGVQIVCATCKSIKHWAKQNCIDNNS